MDTVAARARLEKSWTSSADEAENERHRSFQFLDTSALDGVAQVATPQMVLWRDEMCVHDQGYDCLCMSRRSTR